MDSSATRSSRPARRVAPTVSALGTPADRRRSVLEQLTRLTGPAVGAAAARVADHLPPDLAHLGEDEVTRQLLWLGHACVHGTPDPAQNGAMASLRRRLLDLIQHEVVRQWSTQLPGAGTMFDTLEQLDRAHSSCMTTGEQMLAAELADRGGLDLVVEVAHDMRSPLTSILFLSEVLHRGHSGDLNDVQKRQVGIIYGAALGLVGMATDVMEMSRRGQTSDMEPVPFSVDAMIDAVLDLVRPTVEEKGLDLRVGRLMGGPRFGCPIPLSRVLLNLTTNALKFTQEGHVEVSATARDGDSVEFSVTDTGPGISPGAVSSLYQPFRRLPERETGYYFSGTGLGLAICRRLVAMMGSELRMTSDAAGTRFSFTLELPSATPASEPAGQA